MTFEPADIFAATDACFCESILKVQARLRRPILVGMCGSQGSGKTTTAGRLAERLRAAGLQTAACSLDDFYLTRAERAVLAKQIHQLLATRGVPGTHDLALLERTLAALLSSKNGTKTSVPVFDKFLDDRLPEAESLRISDRVDVVILEGWCVGARPQPVTALNDPINVLERNDDADATWRRFVNEQLAGPYATLFARLDLRLMLRAPAFAVVKRWRSEQERGFDGSRSLARRPMVDEEIARFVAHYERITNWLLEDEPADLIADLDETRVPVRLRWKREHSH